MADEVDVKDDHKDPQEDGGEEEVRCPCPVHILSFVTPTSGAGSVAAEAAYICDLC